MPLIGKIGRWRAPEVGGGGDYAVTLSHSPSLLLGDTGSDESVWSDLSGNGRDFTQATVSKQPTIVPAGLNGRQYRQFSGVYDDQTNLVLTDVLSDVLGTTAVHAFFVVKCDAGAPQAAFGYGVYNVTDYGRFGPDGTAGRWTHIFRSNTTRAGVSTVVDYDTTWMVFECWRDGADMEILYDGVSKATTSSAADTLASTSTAINLGGGSGGYYGKIAALAIFPFKLATTPATNVRAELTGLFFP